MNKKVGNYEVVKDICYVLKSEFDTDYIEQMLNDGMVLIDDTYINIPKGTIIKFINNKIFRLGNNDYIIDLDDGLDSELKK